MISIVDQTFVASSLSLIYKMPFYHRHRALTFITVIYCGRLGL